MKIGIISDTHDHQGNVVRAVEVFNEHKVGCVLHAGDMTSADTAGKFAAVDGAEFVAVFGNCDSDRVQLQRIIENFGGEIYDPSYDGQVDGKAVFMAHRPDMVSGAIGSGKYDLVVYGHTHQYEVHRDGETLIVNPGSAMSRVVGKASVVVMELDDMSCEKIIL